MAPRKSSMAGSEPEADNRSARATVATGPRSEGIEAVGGRVGLRAERTSSVTALVRAWLSSESMRRSRERRSWSRARWTMSRRLRAARASESALVMRST
eukprot:5887017-Prymnesium_polylepis.1